MEDEFIEEDFKQSDQGYFAIIPVIMFEDKRLTVFDVCLFAIITSLTKKHGHCWASNRYLASILKSSERSITRSIRRLKSSEFIRVDFGGDEKRLIFVNYNTPIGPLDLVSYPPTLQSGGVDKLSRGGRQPCLGGVDKYGPPIYDSKVDSKEDSTHSSIAFETLWLKYPKKLGRKAAQRAWRASVKTEADSAAAAAALERFLASSLAQGDPRYIPHGSTWFNNWRDWLTYVEPNGKKSNDLPDSLKHLDR